MLRIVDVILVLIRDLVPVIDAIGRHDAALAKQARDALNSTLLNVAEGSDQRGARRNNHYTIALGSAREAYVALRAAEAWRYVRPLPTPQLDAFDRVIGTLVKTSPDADGTCRARPCRTRGRAASAGGPKSARRI
jgi:four helix bundle protein